MKSIKMLSLMVCGAMSLHAAGSEIDDLGNDFDSMSLFANEFYEVNSESKQAAGVDGLNELEDEPTPGGRSAPALEAFPPGLKELLLSDDDINSHKDERGNKIGKLHLYTALMSNNLPLAHLLVKNGVYLITPDADMTNSVQKFLRACIDLSDACANNQLARAQAAVAQGAYVNARRNRFGTPLNRAIDNWQRDCSVIEYLCSLPEIDANAEYIDGFDFTCGVAYKSRPLHMAYRSCSPEIIEILLRVPGVDVEFECNKLTFVEHMKKVTAGNGYWIETINLLRAHQAGF